MAAEETKDPVMVVRPRRKLVIGIDFGTTYSGIAWALEGAEEEMEVIQEWPGKGNCTSQKVPTVLSYQNNGIGWGYQADHIEEAVRGFKLLLDTSKVFRFTPTLQSGQTIQRMEKKPVEVAGDYLKIIVTHAKDVLGRRGVSSLLRTMHLQYILTVPAVWSDKAKDLTMEAARYAGIPMADLFLLSEPEAAAVHTIRTIQPNSISKGDCFIVCDAGGGTVDLITYRITQTEAIRMEEVTVGTGEICGSFMLDELFQEFLVEAIGERAYNKMPAANKRQIMERWRTDVKHAYSGPEDANDYVDTGHMIPVPGVPDVPGKNIMNGMLHMENWDVQEIFDPVMTKIEDLIAGQEKNVIESGMTTKAIILVGGLGASQYLYKRLESRFQGIEIMQPLNAWSAVVRGAVYRGFEGNQVTNRKARCHYGTRFQTLYDSSVHQPYQKVWCHHEERYMAEDNMCWYICKGDAISEERPIKMSWYRAVPLHHSFVFKDHLWFCVSEDAPARCGDNTSMLCDLLADLSNVPKEVFDLCTNSKGEAYYRVDYDLVLTPLSASLLLDLQINSVSYGTVRARYC
ncbi:hypothetical protein N7532_006055 [Penicillium argentinense]|uniref:Actin-like ATPase domain-containing protein n=1 Tax=Penicillium argentinense TaxID=1131581 RepID=A0A9W9FF66_9EURO|nr:uncharacterized protein N7532_006055 [Penicillium argentinense]KAJ5099054.1 hypothetical protein N7532_006055 [Penicillium argentinense]